MRLFLSLWNKQKIRDIDRQQIFQEYTPIQKASRFIYLNKTCFNGLYRVNNAGHFNSPFGYYKNPNIVNAPTLRAVSNYLNENSIEFLNDDFEIILKSAKRNDFVYLDPPYDPISDTSNFTGYSEFGFNKCNQIRLKQLCDTLDNKGVKFLLSNAATKFILDLYSENSNYKIKFVEAKRQINCKADKRGNVKEVLIYNYGN